MLEIVKEEAKTKEEALENILKKTNLTQDDFFLKSEFVEGKLFKSSKYIVSALKKEDVKNFITEYIENLSKLLNLDITSEILNNNEFFNITLVSDNNAILIGKEGKNLNAIQTILRQAIKTEAGINLKISVDVGNYKLKKMKNIEIEVRKIAEEMEKSHLDVSLDPMNSYERRLVHNIINEYSNLTTESFGEGKDRHVVIKYIEK
ncbi:MAG: KH domain-containing protein [Tenericutes bacterium]|nr:KH domain-containing protein [Mycoplasmatota bacterium]